MERAERLVALAIGLLFSVLLIPMLFLMLGLTIFTAVQRFMKVWKQASSDLVNPRQQLRRERRARRRATRTTWATRSPASWQRRTRKTD